MNMEDQQRNDDTRIPLLPYHHANATPISQQPWRSKICEVVNEVRHLYSIAMPLIITYLLTYGKSAISVAFMGRLGKDALAGGSLAIGFANITGYSVLSGLAMGVDAISSQACGAQRWALVGHTLQRTILILGLCCIPISLLWLNVHPILVFLGQDPAIVSVASTYLTFALPDLFLVALINPVRVYLRSQNITYPLLLSAAVSLSFHLPINYILVSYMGLGVRGVAVSAAIMDLNMLLVMVMYVILKGDHKRTWHGWSWEESLKGWPTIFGLAIPNCISVCLEWWWYELMIVMSGLLPNASDAVATMGILIQATSLIYIFPSSLSLAVSTRVGNELGAGRPANAKASSTTSLCCAIFTSLIALSFSITMRNLWAWAFTSDEAIIALTAAAMPILGLCELGNCPQTTMCGVLRGSARPKLGANINLGSFYGVGLPVAIWMGFYMEMGLLGLWVGLLAAQAACSILMAIMLMRTDWAAEAQRAKELTGSDKVQAHYDDDKKKIVVANEDYEAVSLSKDSKDDKVPLMIKVDQ